MLVMYIDLLYS